MRSSWTRIARNLFLVVAALLLLPLEKTLAESGILTEKNLEIACWSLAVLRWTMLAWVVAGVGGWLLVDILMQRHYKEQMPKLFRDVFTVVVYVVATVLLLNQVFSIPITGLVATTGAVGMVVGFALRDMISDIFSGIAINLEHPFKIGDAVELESGFIGVIQEINWRTTRLLSTDQIVSVVPNGRISVMELHVFSRPRKAWRASAYIKLSHGIPTERVLRVLNAAVRRVDQNLNREKAHAQIDSVDELGVKYRIYYWVRNLDEWAPLKTRVHSCLMEDLYHAGLTPVRPRQELFLGKLPEVKLAPDKKSRIILERVPLLQHLESDELDQLIGRLEAETMESGHRIVEEGAEGNSLFVVTEGLLHVFVKKAGRKKPVLVGSIRSGQCFGEFSLLTGEARSASVETVTECVIYEIRQEHIADILKARPSLAHTLSTLLAERKLQSQQVLDKSLAVAQEKELSRIIFEKMERMFSFMNRPGQSRTGPRS